MTDYSIIESVFLKAVEQKTPAKLSAFLDDHCKDVTIRREVERLLAADPNVGDFLSDPVVSGHVTVDCPMKEGPGTQIGPYRLMEQIGEGGFGLVFVAQQQHPVRRKVALKIIKPGMDSRDVVARFEAERQALALMDHPNIAKVLEAGTTETGRPYFVMELVKGIPIVEYCDKQKQGVTGRLRLFVSVCQAVQHAHSKGVIHRDLKPSNVLVAPHDGIPVAKVIDFGVAKAIGQQLTDKTIYTQFTQMIGTPLYMSPEQAELNALDVDTRSDIYSLGVLLYELLTGTTPFEKQRLASAAFDEMRRIIREEDPPKPSTKVSTMGQQVDLIATHRRTDFRRLREDLRGELDWIVMKALDKDRDRRYETANGFAADIQRYLNDDPVQACPPSTAYKLRKFVRRNRGLLSAVAALLVMLCLGLAGTSMGLVWANAATADARAAERTAIEEGRAAAQARDDADRNLYAADMSLAFQAWRDARIGRLRELLDRHAGSTHRGWEWRYLRRVSRGDEIDSLPAHSSSVWALAFSPGEGRLLASGCDDGTVRLWDFERRQLINELQHNAQVTALAFNPSGEFLAVLSGSYWGEKPKGEVTLWRRERADEYEFFDRFGLPLKDVYWGERGALVFSPDDEFLIVGLNSGDIQVYRYRDQRHAPSTWHANEHAINVLQFSPDGQYLLSGGRNVKAWSWPRKADPPEPAWELNVDGGRVFDIDFSPLDQQCVVCSDKSISIFDANTRDLVKTIPTEWCRGTFTANGERYCSAGADQVLHIWDTRTWNESERLRGHSDAIWSLAVAPQANVFVTGGSDRRVKIWNPNASSFADNKVISDLRDVAFSSDQKTFLTVHEDNSLKLWDANDVEQVREVSLAGLDPLSKSYTLSSDHLATADSAGCIRLWNHRTDSLIKVMGGSDSTTSLVFSPDGRRLAYSTDDLHAYHVVNIPEMEELSDFSFDRHYEAAAFSPDASQLLLQSRLSSQLRICKVGLENHATPFIDHGQRFKGAAFSPEGRAACVGCGAGHMSLFSLVDSKPTDQLQLDPNLGGFFAVCFSPTENRLAALSAADTVWLCDTESGQELGTLQIPVNSMNGKLQFSENGENLLIFDAGTLHIFQAGDPR